MNIMKNGVLIITSLVSISCGHIRAHKDIKKTSNYVLENSDMVHELYESSNCYKKEIKEYNDTCHQEASTVFVFNRIAIINLVCSDQNTEILTFANEIDPLVIEDLNMKLLCSEDNLDLDYTKLYFRNLK
mgnify:CR=1 FL=1